MTGEYPLRIFGIPWKLDTRPIFNGGTCPLLTPNDKYLHSKLGAMGISDGSDRSHTISGPGCWNVNCPIVGWNILKLVNHLTLRTILVHSFQNPSDSCETAISIDSDDSGFTRTGSIPNGTGRQHAAQHLCSLPWRVNDHLNSARRCQVRNYLQIGSPLQWRGCQWEISVGR